MAKILAYKNDQAIEQMTTNLKWTADNAQIFIDKYKNIPLLPELVTADLVNLFFNPRTFFVEKLLEGEVFTIGKLSLNSEKVYDMMDRPAGLDKLVSELEALSSNANSNSKSWREIYLGRIKYMDFLDGNIVPRQSYVDEQIELYSFYIETDNQHAALTLLNEITPKLNALFALKISNENTPLEDLFRASGVGADRIYEPILRSVVNAF
ncbi:hypothetical protein GSF70_03470 [Flavobacteriaceae bacterium W22]|nr:hypothetical protein [Flavobacteriaceae bacterium W22]